MTRSRPIPIAGGCPNCGSANAISLYFEDNHGQGTHLEDHCGDCGWWRSPEGEVKIIDLNDEASEEIHPPGKGKER